MLFENGDRIVFAGDSVTEMESVNPVADGDPGDLGRGFVRITYNMLNTWYPERFIRITNSGVGGNTSRHLLARYDRDVVTLNPDWVVLCIGINDVWRQFDLPQIPEWSVLPEEYKHNVETMITAVKDKVKGVFILSPYLIEVSREDKMRARMDEYVAICQQLAQKHGCIFVDFQAMFDKHCAYQHPCRFSADRVHPNPLGSTLMAREFLRAAGLDFSR